MPAFSLPRDSGAHRVAAVALYRALLGQCRALQLVEAQQTNELQNIVRNRFRQARHEHSTRRLRLAFEAGYEAIDHLDAAVAGSQESTQYILELLSKVPEKAKQPPPITLSKDVVKELKKRIHERPAPIEGTTKAPSILERPLPLEQLSGRRHVPKLFNAQGIPVLRIKKPQPENLSGYINHRLQKKQKRHDTRHRLDDELELARAEDRWDNIVREYTDGVDGSGTATAGARDDGRRGNNSWSYEVAMARREVNVKLEEERQKNAEMAAKMQAVVDQETELYEREKAERKEAKKRRYEDALQNRNGAARERAQRQLCPVHAMQPQSAYRGPERPS